MKVFVIVLLIAGFVSPAAAQFAVHFESPELKSGKVHVSRVALTPVRALVSQLDWKSGPYDLGKPMEAESRQLEKDLRPVVGSTLKGLGFVVDDKSLSPEILAGNKDLDDKVNAVQAMFDMQYSEIASNRKRYENEAASLGEHVPALHVPEDCDAIVIIQAHDYLETGGKKFMNGSPGLHSVGGWDVEVGIVDAKTGAILFIARSDGSNNLVKEPEKAGPKIEKSFKSYFKYAAVPSGPQEPKS
jgi:hypothetical protein